MIRLSLHDHNGGRRESRADYRFPWHDAGAADWPMRQRLRFACVGTYPPRRCGIGTFTYDLVRAIGEAAGDPRSGRVVAIDDVPQGYEYPEEVRFEIRQEDPASYREAADFLSIRGVDVLLVQHEYGIFGGRDGAHLLALLHQAAMPIVTTMHTVLQKPSDHLRRLTEQLIERSDRIVVLAPRGKEILEEVYDVPAEKVVVIPHGIPDVPFVDPSFFKDRFHVEQRTVLLTFGLLSPGKGIEYVIEALPQVVADHPELVFIVLGATHPQVKRTHGEQYRHRLQQMAEELGVWEHVIFENRYVDLDELCEFIGAADIYVTPYLGEEQIVSGTLAYALGSGKAVVSTPYSYAREMLSDGRGRLVPFRDAGALAREIRWLVEHPTECQAMRKRAYLATRKMVWRRVGEAYWDLFQDIARRRLSSPTIRHRPGHELAPRRPIPDLNLGYLRSLSDGTGIYQHAHYTVPNRFHGYCTDDNARALIVALWAHKQLPTSETLELARTYMSFLHYAYNAEQGRFRNFMSYDRRWLEEVGSKDAHGRALWALGFAVALAPVGGLRNAAVSLFDRALPASLEFDSPRAIAYALVGIHAYLRCYSGDADARRIREELALRLFDDFRRNATDDWPWPEEVLTYANGLLPHALLLSGQWLERPEMVEIGVQSLEWLMRVQTGEHGVFSPVGNRGWYPRDGAKACFDQQPIEAQTLIGACLEARNATQDDRWAEHARRAFNWFLGKNDLGQPLYDYQTGGCCDGLMADGLNENQGAESTLAWLISLLEIKSLKPVREEVSPRVPRVHV